MNDGTFSVNGIKKIMAFKNSIYVLEIIYNKLYKDVFSSPFTIVYIYHLCLLSLNVQIYDVSRLGQDV